MAFLEDILVPIFICVVLPVCIVLIVMNARKHVISRKADVALKAIEAGVPVDPEFFRSSKPKETVKQKLLGQLTGACITFLMGAVFLAFNLLDFNADGLHMFALGGGVLMAIGIGLFISFFVGRRMLAKEIEAEESEIGSKDNQ